MARKVTSLTARGIAVGVAAGALLMGVITVGSAQAGTGLPSAQVIAAFNAERTGNGLSAVTENADWSAACAKHNRWMQLNNVMSHFETPGSPGYTAEGAWAGQNAVLAATSWRQGDPFRLAPIHLSQMMSPQLVSMGAAENNGYVCMTTWPGYTTAPAATSSFTWFPGQNSTLTPSETAFESPTVPQTWVGIAEGTATGPHLYVYYTPAADSIAPVFTSASLTGSEGNVPVKVVTETVAAAYGYEGYLPTLAIIIPSKPLRANASYTATVSAGTATSALRFRTGSSNGGGRNQSVKGKYPVFVAKGKNRKLPAATNRGQVIVWHTSSRKVCKIVKKRVVKAKKRGTCKLRGVVPASAEYSGLTITYSLPVR